MSTFISLLILALGVFFALFLFWKLLKEDYEDSDIFALWFISLLGGVFGFGATNFLFPRDGLAGGVILAFVSGLMYAKRFKMNLVEIFEAGLPALLLFLIFFLLSKLFEGLSLGLVAEFLLVILALALFVFFKTHYRRFLWYPSGKVGFASLATSAVYFLLRGLVEILAPRVLSFNLVLFSDYVGTVFGGFVALWSIVVLYIQSGRRDFVGVLKHGEKG